MILSTKNIPMEEDEICDGGFLPGLKFYMSSPEKFFDDMMPFEIDKNINEVRDDTEDHGGLRQSNSYEQLIGTFVKPFIKNSTSARGKDHDRLRQSNSIGKFVKPFIKNSTPARGKDEQREMKPAESSSRSSASSSDISSDLSHSSSLSEATPIRTHRSRSKSPLQDCKVSRYRSNSPLRRQVSERQSKATRIRTHRSRSKSPLQDCKVSRCRSNSPLRQQAPKQQSEATRIRTHRSRSKSPLQDRKVARYRSNSPLRRQQVSQRQSKSPLRCQEVLEHLREEALELSQLERQGVREQSSKVTMESGWSKFPASSTEATTRERSEGIKNPSYSAERVMARVEREYGGGNIYHHIAVSEAACSQSAEDESSTYSYHTYLRNASSLLSTASSEISNEDKSDVSPRPEIRSEWWSSRPAYELIIRCVSVYGWSHDFATSVLMGYFQFLETKTTLKDWKTKTLVPSVVIDQMWQQHILDVVNYVQATTLICGEVVGREPDYMDGVTKPEKMKKIKATKMALRDIYGESLDKEVWDFGPEYTDELVFAYVPPEKRRHKCKKKRKKSKHEEPKSVVPQTAVILCLREPNNMDETIEVVHRLDDAVICN